MLRAALIGGIKVVDTSPSYKAGSSELLVGKVLSSLPTDVQREVEIVTK